MFFHDHFKFLLDYHINFLVVTSLNFRLNFDKLFLVLIFFKISILMKNKIIDLFLLSERREDISEYGNKTNLLIYLLYIFSNMKINWLD